MNSDWQAVKTFESDLCSGTVYVKDRLRMKIKGVAKADINWTACAPTDLRMSYSGSGLPFGSAKMAFSYGVQRGSAKAGKFKVILNQPNSYYDEGTLVPPTVYISSSDLRISLQVAEPIPNRSLHSLPDRPKRNSRGAI